MSKILTILAYLGLILIQTEPGFCEASKTTTFQLSVTIPDHVIVNNNLKGTSFSINPYQLAQTETVIRGNKTILLTSIVVP